MSVWRKLLFILMLAVAGQASADDVFDLDHFSRYLQTDQMLEGFRGTGGEINGSFEQEDSAGRLLLGYGARVLCEGRFLEEREGLSRQGQWFSLRLQLLGHVAIAAAHAQTDAGLEEAIRHLTEANRLVDRMEEFEPFDRDNPARERAIYAVRTERLLFIPLALTAHRLAKNTKRSEHWATASACYEVAMKSAWPLDQFWGRRGRAEVENERRSRNEGLINAAVPKDQLEQVKKDLEVLSKEFQQLKDAVANNNGVLDIAATEGMAASRVFDIKQLDVDQDNSIRSREISILERRITRWRNWTATFIPK